MNATSSTAALSLQGVSTPHWPLPPPFTGQYALKRFRPLNFPDFGAIGLFRLPQFLDNRPDVDYYPD
jgi:hypothetical protein